MILRTRSCGKSDDCNPDDDDDDEAMVLARRSLISSLYNSAYVILITNSESELLLTLCCTVRANGAYIYEVVRSNDTVIRVKVKSMQHTSQYNMFNNACFAISTEKSVSLAYALHFKRKCLNNS
jgi:hypothetical protein